jgi:hypothetical protein
MCDDSKFNFNFMILEILKQTFTLRLSASVCFHAFNFATDAAKKWRKQIRSSSSSLDSKKGDCARPLEAARMRNNTKVTTGDLGSFLEWVEFFVLHTCHTR